MLNRMLSTAVILGAAIFGFTSVAGATLIGDSMNVRVISGAVDLNDTVVVADPAVEISKNDGTNIGDGFFGLNIGFDYFESASIDIQAFDIFITLDVADALAGSGDVVGATFIFDLVDFAGGLPIGSVGLGVSSNENANYTAARNGKCQFSDCVDFDSNTISVEIFSPNTEEFTYRLNPQPVPEPGTFVLLGAGLLGAAVLRRRRKA